MEGGVVRDSFTVAVKPSDGAAESMARRTRRCGALDALEGTT